MGEKINLEITERKVHGKKVKSLLKQGLVPGVVYGNGVDSISIQADASEVRRVVSRAGYHTPIHLTGAKKRVAMIKDVSFDPIKSGVVRHISLHAVRANEPVYAEIPVRLDGEGESVAERAGLVVLQAVERIEVRALPMDLPDAIVIDIRALAEHGDKVTLGDAKLPQGVEFAERDSGRAEDDDEERPVVTDLVVASVYEPAALEAANDAAAGSAEDVTVADTDDASVSPESPAESN